MRIWHYSLQFSQVLSLQWTTPNARDTAQVYLRIFQLLPTLTLHQILWILLSNTGAYNCMITDQAWYNYMWISTRVEIYYRTFKVLHRRPRLNQMTLKSF